MASYGEVNMSVLGLIFMFTSETFEAIRLVMTQILLVGLKFHPSEPLLSHAFFVIWAILSGVQPFALPLLHLRPNVFVSAERMCRGPAAGHQELASPPGTDMTARCVAAAIEGLKHLAPACLVAAAAGSDLLQVAKQGAGLITCQHAVVPLLLNFGALDCS